MQLDMRDLLQEAKADPPPPRYGVADVVAAGRRLRRRRRAGWTIAAATAIVVVIGVPAIVTRLAPVPHPVGRLPAQSPFVYTFQGYVAAGFRVDDPSQAGLAGVTASVYPAGAPSTGTAPAKLQVLYPGVSPAAADPTSKITAGSPVGGRPAHYVDADAFHVQFIWQYAANGYAVLTANRTALTPDEMHGVAAAFKIGASRPATIGFMTGPLPTGYRLVDAGGVPSRARVGGAATSYATFLVDSEARAQAGRPDRVDQQNPPVALKLSLARRDTSFAPVTDPEDVCQWASDDYGTSCLRPIEVGDGKYELTATATSLDAKQLTAILDRVRLATLYDAATWWPVTRAFPAGAQLPG